MSHQHRDPAAFAGEMLPRVAESCHATYVAFCRRVEGRWTVTADLGVRQPLPLELMAEALDREDVADAPSWAALPVGRWADYTEVLAIFWPVSADRATDEQLSALAAVVRQALEAIRSRDSAARRVQRLETILQISRRLNRNEDMERLLVELAEAATRLIGADRASIFLWDKPNKLLVGRPALGVEGGELRIPHDAGIVGQVLHSGSARRVDHAGGGQSEINRRIDARTGYQTRTLLCVPLRGRRGELFGVFEMINKLAGNFTDEDQETLEELAGQAAILLENTQERQALLESRRLMTDQAAEGVRLVGISPAVSALRSTISRVASTELAVLILGENGTGKEVVSQSIHYLSPRRHQPFIAVNCAALSETLLESELFGHEKGAFTDAHAARPGKFELANGGTLFLDEIGDLSAGGQAKLLRVLEEKVVVRVGGTATIHTDARVIAATNQNLAQMVREKRFRQDLYFRLNVVSLELPPLRERREDVIVLAEHFLEDCSRKARRTPPRLASQARKRLEHHDWPGNVRELRNLMERLAFLCPEDEITADDPALTLTPWESPAKSLPSGLSLTAATDSFQAEYIQRAIDSHGGNVSAASRDLGLHRSNLYRKMKQLGMKTE